MDLWHKLRPRKGTPVPIFMELRRSVWRSVAKVEQFSIDERLWKGDNEGRRKWFADGYEPFKKICDEKNTKDEIRDKALEEIDQYSLTIEDLAPIRGDPINQSRVSTLTKTQAILATEARELCGECNQNVDGEQIISPGFDLVAMLKDKIPMASENEDWSVVGITTFFTKLGHDFQRICDEKGAGQATIQNLTRQVEVLEGRIAIIREGLGRCTRDNVVASQRRSILEYDNSQILTGSMAMKGDEDGMEVDEEEVDSTENGDANSDDDLSERVNGTLSLMRNKIMIQRGELNTVRTERNMLARELLRLYTFGEPTDGHDLIKSLYSMNVELDFPGEILAQRILTARYTSIVHMADHIVSDVSQSLAAPLTGITFQVLHHELSQADTNQTRQDMCHLHIRILMPLIGRVRLENWSRADITYSCKYLCAVMHSRPIGVERAFVLATVATLCQKSTHLKMVLWEKGVEMILNQKLETEKAELSEFEKLVFTWFLAISASAKVPASLGNDSWPYKSLLATLRPVTAHHDFVDVMSASKKVIEEHSTGRMMSAQNRGSYMFCWKLNGKEDKEGDELVFVRWRGEVWMFERGLELKWSDEGYNLRARPMGARHDMPWFSVGSSREQVFFLMKWYAADMERREKEEAVSLTTSLMAGIDLVKIEDDSE